MASIDGGTASRRVRRRLIELPGHRTVEAIEREVSIGDVRHLRRTVVYHGKSVAAGEHQAWLCGLQPGSHCEVAVPAHGGHLLWYAATVIEVQREDVRTEIGGVRCIDVRYDVEGEQDEEGDGHRITDFRALSDHIRARQESNDAYEYAVVQYMCVDRRIEYSSAPVLGGPWEPKYVANLGGLVWSARLAGVTELGRYTVVDCRISGTAEFFAYHCNRCNRILWSSEISPYRHLSGLEPGRKVHKGATACSAAPTVDEATTLAGMDERE